MKRFSFAAPGIASPFQIEARNRKAALEIARLLIGTIPEGFDIWTS